MSSAASASPSYSTNLGMLLVRRPLHSTSPPRPGGRGWSGSRLRYSSFPRSRSISLSASLSEATQTIACSINVSESTQPIALLPEFDPADAVAGRGLVERLTVDAAALQQEVLTEILTRNSHTEYLRRFLGCLPPGADLLDAFKGRVPVVRYEDIRPYVYRVLSGEPSSILCSEPITDLVRSSGTSGGHQKLYPSTKEKLEQRRFYNAFEALVRKMHLHADQEKCGKGMYLMFTFPGKPCTLSGLPVHASSTAYCYSSHFRYHDIGRYTSPIEAVLCPDGKQSMYCQLLCGLIDRGIVDHVGAAFANGFVKGIRFLEDYWEEMCLNIRTGHLSDWITNAPLRDAITQRYLHQPDPALADEIVSQCAGKPWDGILRRLWPGARYIVTIVTGSMSQYIPILESYGAGLQIVSHTYASTECAVGINIRPLDPPSRASYALLPNLAYYEFAEIKRGDDEEVQGTAEIYDNLGGTKLVDLMDVQIGRCYELVITTFAGLYRYRVGDLFTVSGFYNATPLFHYSGRQDVALSIDYETISEQDLLKAVSKAYELHLRPLGYMLGGCTAYADISTLPGHYVLFWELVRAESDHIASDIDRTVMENCCWTVEGCFDQMYGKSRHRDSIRALEIRVVKHGAFDALMDFFVSRGTSPSQYKTPTVIRSKEALMLLEERVSGRFFSQGTFSGPVYEYERK